MRKVNVSLSEHVKCFFFVINISFGRNTGIFPFSCCGLFSGKALNRVSTRREFVFIFSVASNDKMKSVSECHPRCTMFNMGCKM